MASLTYNSATHRAVIQAERPNDPTRRFTLSVPKVSRKVAESIKLHVEHLVNSKASGEPIPPQTAVWLRDVGAKLHSRLAAAGLVTPREAVAAVGLKAFGEQYIKGRTDLKERSRIIMGQALRQLTDHFGATHDLRKITTADGREWRRKLAAHLAGPTVATHVKKARQIFADAVERRLITENPFAKVEAGSFVNEETNVYVPVADVESIIAICPDAEWRLIFGLARFAGLRTPSETFLLRWSDVDWSTETLTVRSPKTERHKGKDKRKVPIVPRLLELLSEAFALAEDGAVYVIARHRNANHRTLAAKLMDRAGVTKWPKPFQNLRASCETDLATSLPLHVACAIIGNSEVVARRHYLKVTDEHFNLARKALYGALQTTADRIGHFPVSIQKTPESAGAAENQCTRQESNPGGISLENLQASHLALQRALHEYILEQGRQNRRLVRTSRRQLSRARRAGRGRA